MRRKKDADNMAKYASLEQISTVLNCTPRWINRLVKEQGFPKEGRGQYDLIKCVHWYIEYLKNQNEQRKTGNSKSEYEAIREKYKALREEIEFKKDVVGSALSIDDHEIRLEKIVTHIITKLETIPYKASTKYANASSTVIKRGLKELIDQIRDELSDYNKYRLQLDNNSGGTRKSTAGRKKSVKTVRSQKKTKTKRVGK